MDNKITEGGKPVLVRFLAEEWNAAALRPLHQFCPDDGGFAMAIRFPCPHCQKLLSVGTRKAGFTFFCPTCKGQLLVPAVSVPSPTDCLDESAPAEPKATLQGPASKHGLAAVLLSLVAGALLVAGMLKLMTKPAGDGEAKQDATAFAAADEPGRGQALPDEARVAEQPMPPKAENPAANPRPASEAGEPEKADSGLPPLQVPMKNRSEALPKPALPSKKLPPLPEKPAASRDDVREPASERGNADTPAAPSSGSSSKPGAGGNLLVKRRNDLLDEDLRKQLLAAPEIMLDAVPGTTAGLMAAAARLQQSGLAYPGSALVARKRADLVGLPLRLGGDCQLGKEPAEELQVLSRKLRVQLEASSNRRARGSFSGRGTLDPRPDSDHFRQGLLHDTGQREWLRPEAVPALLQLLQAENKPLRLVLVELLSLIKDKRASAALAIRAIVDLSPEVRAAAIVALKERPAEEYRGLLLAGLRYPWPAAADHAAEALAALGDQGAISTLVKFLEEPDPSFPFTIGEGKQPKLVVRELVCVNHLANCVLCHAPSFSRNEPVRGAVPTPGQPLPAPATTPQYYEQGGTFVRADITYLRQDFSVMQTVAIPGAWPSNQRYDYLLRIRRLTPRELKLYNQMKENIPAGPQRDAVLFALRELTGKDLGTTAAEWRRALPKERAVQTLQDLTARAATADWQQFLPQSQPQASAEEGADASRLARQLVKASPEEQERLLDRLKEGKGAAYTDALAEAIPPLAGAVQTNARDALAIRLGRMTATTLRDKLQDENGEIRRAAALACAMKQAKVHIPDLIAALEDREALVVRAVHAALKNLTGQDFGPEADASPAECAKAAAAWAKWWDQQISR